MAKKNIPDLIIEYMSHETNLHLLSLIEHRGDNYLVVIDNVSHNEVGAFVLDYAEQEQVDIQKFMSIANYWLVQNSMKYPLSIEFSKNGLTPHISKIYKTFSFYNITRIIGKSFTFDLHTPKKVKRKKANFINLADFKDDLPQSNVTGE